MQNLNRILVIIMAAAFLAACGDKPATDAGEDQSSSPQMIERKAATPKPEPAAESQFKQPSTSNQAMIENEGRLTEDGSGLDLVINATDAAAFSDSLRWIAEDTSKEQFDRLETALRVIRTYHPQVLGSEERMMHLVDGKTGNELIVESVRVMQNRTGG